MVFSIYSSLSRFNKKMFNFSINPKMRDIRTGDHKDPRNRMNEYGNGKSRKICWTQNLYSQNIQRINHFRISIFTSKLAKFWQTKKNILRSFSIYFLLDFLGPRQGSTNDEWTKENVVTAYESENFELGVNYDFELDDVTGKYRKI